MKKSIVAIALLSSAAMAASASASLLVYEPFNYTSGTNLGISGSNPYGAGNAGPDGVVHAWAQTGTGTSGLDDVQTTSGNLAVPAGLPTATGNMTVFGGDGYTDRINLGTSTSAYSSGSLYYSMAVQINDLGTLGTLNGIVAGFNNSTGTQTGNPTIVGADLWVKAGATANTFNLGISTTSATGTRSYGATPTDITLGTTVFVVGEYDFVTGSANDTSELYLFTDPSTADLSTQPSATASGSAADVSASLNSFLLYQVLASSSAKLGNSSVNVDELRIGTSWADVTSVPEPASLSLLGLGAIAGLARRRRA